MQAGIPGRGNGVAGFAAASLEVGKNERDTKHQHKNVPSLRLFRFVTFTPVLLLGGVHSGRFLGANNDPFRRFRSTEETLFSFIFCFVLPLIFFFCMERNGARRVRHCESGGKYLVEGVCDTVQVGGQMPHRCYHLTV